MGYKNDLIHITDYVLSAWPTSIP